jgi:hypothetical protein
MRAVPGPRPALGREAPACRMSTDVNSGAGREILCKTSSFLIMAPGYLAVVSACRPRSMMRTLSMARVHPGSRFQRAPRRRAGRRAASDGPMRAMCDNLEHLKNKNQVAFSRAAFFGFPVSPLSPASQRARDSVRAKVFRSVAAAAMRITRESTAESFAGAIWDQATLAGCRDRNELGAPQIRIAHGFGAPQASLFADRIADTLVAVWTFFDGERALSI